MTELTQEEKKIIIAAINGMTIQFQIKDSAAAIKNIEVCKKILAKLEQTDKK